MVEKGEVASNKHVFGNQTDCLYYWNQTVKHSYTKYQVFQNEWNQNMLNVHCREPIAMYAIFP